MYNIEITTDSRGFNSVVMRATNPEAFMQVKQFESNEFDFFNLVYGVPPYINNMNERELREYALRCEELQRRSINDMIEFSSNDTAFWRYKALVALASHWAAKFTEQIMQVRERSAIEK